MCKRSVQIESVFRRRVANTNVNWLSDFVKSCNINFLSLAVNLLLWNTIGPVIGSDSNIDEADPLFNPFTNSELEGGGGQHHVPAALLPGKISTNCPGGWPGWERKISPPPHRDSISGPYSRDSAVDVATMFAAWTVRGSSPCRVNTASCSCTGVPFRGKSAVATHLHLVPS